MTTQPRLSIHRLSYHTSWCKLLQHVDIKLNPGQGLLVTGANGSGKTTFLRLLSGMLAPSSGAIRWQGQIIDSQLAYYRRHISYLGHRQGVHSQLTVTENLYYQRLLQGFERRYAQQAVLATWQLERYRDTLACALSAGCKQRLALACLLSFQTSVWLLDEPLTSLDKASRLTAQKVIAEFLGRGGIVVVASHESSAVYAGFDQLEL